MKRLFGTDGVRGAFGREPLDRDTIIALGRVLGRETANGGSRDVVAAGDTRDSTPQLAQWLALGLAAEGARLRWAGVLPTGAVAWLGTASILGKDTVISILGLVISVAAALESIFQFRETWKVYNSIALNMDNERTKFQYRSGDYKGLSDQDAFNLLVERVESFNSQSSKDLVGVLTQASKG